MGLGLLRLVFHEQEMCECASFTVTGGKNYDFPYSCSRVDKRVKKHYVRS